MCWVSLYYLLQFFFHNIYFKSSYFRTKNRFLRVQNTLKSKTGIRLYQKCTCVHCRIAVCAPLKTCIAWYRDQILKILTEPPIQCLLSEVITLESVAVSMTAITSVSNFTDLTFVHFRFTASPRQSLKRETIVVIETAAHSDVTNVRAKGIVELAVDVAQVEGFLAPLSVRLLMQDVFLIMHSFFCW